MTMTIEPTGEMSKVNGILCRRWIGVTARGVECDLFIPVIRVREEADRAEFELYLQGLPQPSWREPAIDMRFLT